MKIFVYGTLKRGFGANRYLLNCPLVAPEAVIEGAHMVSLGGFPGVFLKGRPGTSGQVYGEVYEVDDTTLKNLDMYESNGSFYQRRKVTTTAGMEVEVYELLRNSETFPVVEDGVWTRAA